MEENKQQNEPRIMAEIGGGTFRIVPVNESGRKWIDELRASAAGAKLQPK